MTGDMDTLVKRLRPVVVFLHGGGFQHGGGDFDGVGPERFMDNKEDIILVTLNYRLGPLGTISQPHVLLANLRVARYVRLLKVTFIYLE